MIKRCKTILFGIIALAIVPKMVYAVGLTCDNQTYTITKGGTNVFSLNGGGEYNLNFYNTSSNGASNVKTYCLDPGRKGPSGTTYICDRMIDPTGQVAGVGTKQHALDVAITRAYYLLAQSHNSGSDFDRSIGEIVFRWLFFNYNLGDTEITMNYSTGSRYVDYFKLEYGGGVKSYWNGLSGTNGEIAEEAKRIFYDAVSVGNRVYRDVGGSATYQDLVRDGTLPSDEFQYTVTESTDASMGGRKIYTVQFTAVPAGATVWWDEFSVGVDGGNVKIVDKKSDGNGKFVITVNEGSNPGQYSLYIDASYYASNIASTSLKILKSRVNGLQRMLVAVDTGNSGDAHAVIKGGKRIPLNDGCVNKGGTWYICQYDEYGVEQNCQPDTGGVCSTPTPSGKTCSVENGVYFGNSGSVVTPTQFYDECCESGLLTGDEYDLYCPCGDPDINFIGACSEFNSDSEIINTVKDTKDNARLKTCLFNQASTDAAGNSVKMTDTTTVVNNAYCKVSCIEEYEFKLPNAQYTTSGGYFSLTSEVSGTRRCYVNASAEGNYEGIDYEQFIADLFDRSKKLAEAQSTYNKLSKAIANLTSENESGCRGGDATVWYNEAFSYIEYKATLNGTTINLSSDPIDIEKKTWSDGSPAHSKGSPGHSDYDYCHYGATQGTQEGVEESILGTKKVNGKKVTKSLSEDYAPIITRYEKEIQNILQQYDDCVHGWENQFSFSPSIEFEYDEPYQDMSGFNKTFEQISTDSSSHNYYCNAGAVGNNYNCTSTSDNKMDQTYITCSNNSCSQGSRSISTARYVIKEKAITAIYQPKNKFSVYTPLGTIQLNKDTGLYTLLCKEENCLPVSLNTPTGVFNFKFKFGNIGQYNDSNTNGRLMGGSNNVFDAVNVDAGYVCQYVNNCPECDYVCVGDHCDIDEDEKPCPTCPYVCQNCIFDGSENTFAYRTVSINNLFPNNRTYGPNWNNEKGQYTKKLIENSGDEAYKEPEYEYTIDATQIAKIKQFNKDVGNYLNTQMPNGDDALICHDLKSNGVTYENIYCESAFLNTTGKTYFTETKRNDTWTLWPDSGYFTSSAKYVVRDGVGPAWR